MAAIDRMSGVEVSAQEADWPPPAAGTILTTAQRGVLQALADGLTAQEYAGEAHIAHATVKFHLAAARRRLHARTTVRAVVRAIELGEVTIARRDVTICGACGGSGVIEVVR